MPASVKHRQHYLGVAAVVELLIVAVSSEVESGELSRLSRPLYEFARAWGDTAGVGVVPVVDVPAPRLMGEQYDIRVGGDAVRIELDDPGRSDAMSAWYRLASVDGGTRLRVFEHYATTTRGPESDIVLSENAAWRFANQAVGADSSYAASDELPGWARFRTGDDTGPSAGLMFALAYIDALTPGALVGNLRVAGTGGIGVDGVVIPVSNVEIKVAVAMLTQPDVIFTPTPSGWVEHTTIVESEHTRDPDVGFTVGEWLNVSGYQQAGRDSAHHRGTVAFVVVHDVRQALAWLCGRTASTTTCTAAHRSASIPIGRSQLRDRPYEATPSRALHRTTRSLS